MGHFLSTGVSGPLRRRVRGADGVLAQYRVDEGEDVLASLRQRA
jgi:hypothetical protein